MQQPLSRKLQHVQSTNPPRRSVSVTLFCSQHRYQASQRMSAAGAGQPQQLTQSQPSWASTSTQPTLTLPALDAAVVPGPPLSVHSIVLLQLLRYWVLSNSELIATCRDPHFSDLTPQQVAVQSQQLERLALFLWRHIQGGDSHTQPSYQQLVHSLSGCLGLLSDESDAGGAVAVVEWLHDALQCVASPDAIDGLFSVELPALLADFTALREQADDDAGVLPVVDANSAFGLFIRYQQLLYNCASFDEVGRLFEQCVEYVGGAEVAETPSAAQLLAFVRSQAAAVQSSIGRHSHSAMQQLCDDVAESTQGRAPAASAFLSYVTALANCDYEEATRQLHRFADLSSSLDPTADRGASGSERMRNGLLNLALLHARFGHTDLCVELLDECIRLCQSSQDTRTLQHAVHTLTALIRDQPAAAAAASLYQRCVDAQAVSAEAAAQAVEQWKTEQGTGSAPQLDQLESVHAQSFLSAAQAELMRPLSSPPAQSSLLASISPPAVWSSLASSASLSAVYDLQQCMAVERQLRSQAWQLFGARHLAGVWAEINYHAASAASTTDDSLSTLCSLASDAQCSADAQQELLAFARSEFPHLSHLPLVDLTHFVRFRLALQRSDIATAALYARALAQLTAAVSDTAPFAFRQQCEARIAALHVHWVQGRRRAAWMECASLCAQCVERREVSLTIRLLLIQAELCLQTEEDEAEAEQEQDSAPSSAATAYHSAVECERGAAELSGGCRALPLLMEASKLCDRAAADVQAAAVSALLARCYLALGRAADGLKAIRRVLPAILEHGSTQQLVDAMHTLALCYLAVEPDPTDDGAECLREAAAVLGVALDAAHSLQWRKRCVQLAYLYARVCHELGWLDEREKATQHFAHYSRQQAGVASAG